MQNERGSVSKTTASVDLSSVFAGAGREQPRFVIDFDPDPLSAEITRTIRASDWYAAHAGDGGVLEGLLRDLEQAQSPDAFYEACARIKMYADRDGVPLDLNRT
jgi:hypothetical protein